MIQVYALVEAPPRRGPSRGPGGERLQLTEVAGLFVVHETIATPALTKENLLARDAFVRTLAASVDAILPARWGSTVASEPDLEVELAPRATSLLEALALVRGREQMTLRFASDTKEDKAERPRSGTEYLEARARAAEWSRSAPELEPLRSKLALVRAEKVERRPGLVSVYHLVDRGHSPAWLAVFERTAFRGSGPFPPYAFAPELP